ncbi:MAG: hypothetical protein H6R17_1389 [Proteobacteria bacterium]|nr:hypothetical protein [Pseudomonadota bacterium]
MQLCCIMAAVLKNHDQAMSTDSNHHPAHAPARPNSPLCAGASTRMLWAALALTLLWVTIVWALS